MVKSPTTACDCLTTEDLMATLPSWAVQDVVFEALEIRDDSEENWRVCPFEEHSRDCIEEGQYWNELACSCLWVDIYSTPNGEPCTKSCEAGEVLDPTERCGDCITEEMMRSRYTIAGTQATDAQISTAEQDGMSTYWNIVEGNVEWPECYLPPGVVQDECPSDMWFSRLTCGCLIEYAVTECNDFCPYGLVKSPMTACECLTTEELMA